MRGGLIIAALLALTLGGASAQTLGAIIGPPAAPRPAPAETVVAGLSRDAVAITADFTGSEILIYGAVKRETPVPPGPPLDVIVTLEAPSRGVTIRRKERSFGIWMNRDAVPVGAAPAFYAVASSAPLDHILSPQEDATHRITIARAIRAFGGPLKVDDTRPFTEALLRIRDREGMYVLDQAGVTIVDQTLFRADIKLPSNLIEGMYKTRIFLLRDGMVIDAHSAAIEVHKVGLERWLYQLSRHQPLIYGLMSLAIAVLAGWAASAAFRLIRR
ncbi:TIGR02186 family protein [Paracoccus sp. p4-l81]|uniref:TIGR02186 family protein n=1 Tax=unclassified Paracoccus (in: a-proteobacteria) TaxID=2688777 RepID=UPI0035B722A1